MAGVGEGEARVWGLIAASARRRGAPISAQDGCDACARALSVDGVGMSLIAGGRLEPVCVTGDLSRDLLEAELMTGDGPSAEAVITGGPVLVPDLRRDEYRRRWPVFAATAQDTAVRAVFAFPLLLGAARIAVLVLCRNRPAPLTPGQHTDALVFADAIMALLLNEQAGLGEQALPAESLALGPELHQAAGMVSEQLDCPIEDAMVRLRAHAFAHGVPVTQVAQEVIERRLRFTPDVSSQG
ncbi:GAF and ANTAR domain-containing protein [Actinomadura gamaensis]|uniref:GAF and ANTAR domain-containing protein n=1 Tax=Actinomadura gamaensis TaxID=1763541 RepID=A0ABV9U6J5_9ACTN